VSVLVALVAAGISVAALPAMTTGRAPQITALRAKADAYVTAATRYSNFGRTPRLSVDGLPPTRTYLRFRRNNVHGEVRRVNLMVYAHSRSRLGYQVRLATRGWNERRITFENAPRPSTRFVSSGRLVVGAWKAVDVTRLVGDLEHDVSFVLTTVATQAIVLASRESGLYGPRLVIEYEDPGTTSLTTTEHGPSNWP
jgi:hypothetical protein